MPYNKSFTDQVQGQDGLDIGFVLFLLFVWNLTLFSLCVFMDFVFDIVEAIKMQKENLANIQPS